MVHLATQIYKWYFLIKINPRGVHTYHLDYIIKTDPLLQKLIGIYEYEKNKLHRPTKRR